MKRKKKKKNELSNFSFRSFTMGQRFYPFVFTLEWKEIFNISLYNTHIECWGLFVGVNLRLRGF